MRYLQGRYHRINVVQIATHERLIYPKTGLGERSEGRAIGGGVGGDERVSLYSGGGGRYGGGGGRGTLALRGSTAASPISLSN